MLHYNTPVNALQEENLPELRGLIALPLWIFHGWGEDGRVGAAVCPRPQNGTTNHGRF
jgi:hypothetical protein